MLLKDLLLGNRLLTSISECYPAEKKKIEGYLYRSIKKNGPCVLHHKI